jgi:hypothetical protein
MASRYRHLATESVEVGLAEATLEKGAGVNAG